MDPVVSLKPLQQEAVKRILTREDVFVCVPTGFRKSLQEQNARASISVMYKNIVEIKVTSR